MLGIGRLSTRSFHFFRGCLPRDRDGCCHRQPSFLFAMLKTHLRKYLTTKDTEYAVGLPTDVRRIEFSTPSNADVQYSFTQGEVGTATFEGEVVFEREDTGDLRFVPDTLYLASNMPGTIMDLDIWHGD